MTTSSEIKKLREKAQSGDHTARRDLGVALFRQAQAKKKDDDYAESYALLSQLADKTEAEDDSEALYLCGVMLQNGLGVQAEPEKALQMYLRARETGHVLATRNVGICFQVGLGTDADLNRAAEFYETGANGGDGGSAHNLAALYHAGSFGSVDFEKARYWYRKAIELSHEPSRRALKELDAADPDMDTIEQRVERYHAKPRSLWDRLIGRR